MVEGGCFDLFRTIGQVYNKNFYVQMAPLFHGSMVQMPPAQIMSDNVPRSPPDSPRSPDEDWTVPYWDLLWAEREEQVRRFRIGLAERTEHHLLREGLWWARLFALFDDETASRHSVETHEHFHWVYSYARARGLHP